MLLLTLPLLAAGLVAAPAPADTLREQIRRADTQLFAAVFEACDADRAAAMTTDDMEFFHDKDGKSASSREDFRHSVANLCSSAREGGWQLRRELVESSLQVFPLHDERALEIGDHRFYERGKDGVSGGIVGHRKGWSDGRSGVCGLRNRDHVRDVDGVALGDTDRGSARDRSQLVDDVLRRRDQDRALANEAVRAFRTAIEGVPRDGEYFATLLASKPRRDHPARP